MSLLRSPTITGEGTPTAFFTLPAFMRNLAPGDPNSEKYYSEAGWWVGWGGSGGRWLYIGSNSNNSSHARGWHADRPDVDDPTRKILPSYSRGFFLVPSEDDKVELTTTRSDRRLYFHLGNQRNGDFARHISRFVLPEETTIPVPKEPTVRARTWGKRYLDAREERFKDPEIIDPNDVVRTWVSRHGDHRLQYIREREQSIQPEQFLFVPHPDWDPEEAKPGAADRLQIHSFTLPGGTPEPGATFNRGLVRGVGYSHDHIPDFTIDPDNDDTFDENRPAGISLFPRSHRNPGTGITGRESRPMAPIGTRSMTSLIDSRDRYPPTFSNRSGTAPLPMPSMKHRRRICRSPAPRSTVPSIRAAATGLQWTTYLFRPDMTPGGHLGGRDRAITGDRTGAPPRSLHARLVLDAGSAALCNQRTLFPLPGRSI